MKILEAKPLKSAVKSRAKQYEDLKGQVETLKKEFQGMVDLDDDLSGAGATAIKNFYRAQVTVAKAWIDLFDTQITFLKGIPDLLEDADLSGETVVEVPFLEGEVAHGLTNAKSMVNQQSTDLQNIFQNIEDILPLSVFKQDDFHEKMESAETEKNNTIKKVQDVDSKLVREYAVSKEQEKVAIGLIQALLEATSKDGTVSPMNFNQSAFQASEAYQVKDEVAKNMKDYRDFKKQEEETWEVEPDMEAIYAGLAKQNIKSGRSDDSIMDPNTGDYALTFEGKRNVLGGNGPGTPDGLAPYAVAATDFLLGDIATMVGPGSTANERITAAAFTFIKPIKVLDKGHDVLKGVKIKDVGKGTENVKYGEQYTKINRKKTLRPNVEYTTKEGYKYTTDHNGRIAIAEAKLELGKAKRNPYAQRTVGGDDRLTNDDGGHLIASIFKGSGEIDNLVPMNATLNRSEYKTLENTWKKALEEGKEVTIKVKPIYEAQLARPSEFKINYTIDGKKYSDRLTNYPGGK